MTAVDLGVDHGNQHVIPAVDAVRFQKMELANDVLLGARIRRGLHFDRGLGLGLDGDIDKICLPG